MSSVTARERGRGPKITNVTDETLTFNISKRTAQSDFRNNPSQTLIIVVRVLRNLLQVLDFPLFTFDIALSRGNCFAHGYKRVIYFRLFRRGCCRSDGPLAPPLVRIYESRLIEKADTVLALPAPISHAQIGPRCSGSCATHSTRES
ncbi:hypothetical protein J6590_046405 [Homalodisca vitripennis]|nr:hypothetical protein J6590_046405 [Homalodisca vitripennis]